MLWGEHKSGVLSAHGSMDRACLHEWSSRFVDVQAAQKLEKKGRRVRYTSWRLTAIQASVVCVALGRADVTVRALGVAAVMRSSKRRRITFNFLKSSLLGLGGPVSCSSTPASCSTVVTLDSQQSLALRQGQSMDAAISAAGCLIPP